MFDRTTWIALALCLAGLIFWQNYITKNNAALNNKSNTEEVTSTPEPATNSVASEENSSSSNNTSSIDDSDNSLSSSSEAEKTALAPIKTEEKNLNSPKATYRFENNIGAIKSISLFIHLGEKAKSVQLNKLAPTPLGTLQDQEGKTINGFTMQTDPKTGKASFERLDHNGLKIEKSFSLPETNGSPDDYLLQFDLHFTNTSKHTLNLPAYRLSCGGAFPVHARDNTLYTRFDWFSGKKMNGVNVNWFAAGKIPIIGIETHSARELYQIENPEVSWVAVTSQYFCTIMSVAPKSSSAVWAKQFSLKNNPDIENSSNRDIYGIEGGLLLNKQKLAPGETVTQHYQIYAGPKNFFALKKLPHGEEHVMNFGTFPIISEFLLWSMDFLRQLLGNYAAAIILLTLIIKIILWPIQDQATTSMKRMQALSPRMTQLREKYKDNPTKMNEELMKLYKKYGINPFGGCLPMLIQIPIFFGFYSMLGSAIELRNSHFLWIQDLSQPDTIGHLFGLPINLLPLIMAGTMLWQMALSPKGGDPAQQKMTYFMPVIFLSFCYNFASALALYWTTQNLFSIAQLYVTRNRPIPDLAELEAPPTSSKTRKKKK